MSSTGSEQPSEELVKAVAAYLLLTAHEGGGSYGKVCYAAAAECELLFVEDEER